MQTLSPSTDRIGAALKALRQAHASDPGSEDETALGLKCLNVVVGQLAEEGLAPEDLKPLAQLEKYLRARGATPAQAERRKSRAPSEVFLAPCRRLIDLLVKAGAEEGEAAQIVMRWLLAAGVPPRDCRSVASQEGPRKPPRGVSWAPA